MAIVDPPVQLAERIQASIVEVLSEGVLVVDAAGALLQANDAARTLLGLALDPCEGSPTWWRVLDPRMADGAPLSLRGGPGGGLPPRRDLAVTILRGDGERRTLRMNHALLRDSDGGRLGTAISFRDVTEQERESARLQASEAALRDAHQLASLASWEWDVVKEELTVLQALPGLAADGAGNGMALGELLAAMLPEDRAEIERRLAELHTGAADHQRLRYRYRLGDGELGWVESHARAIRDADGSLVAIRGTTQDVTAAHRAAAELREARDFLQSTMDALGQHVAVLDEHGVILATNAAWAGFTGHGAGCEARSGVGVDYVAAYADATDLDHGAAAAAGLRAVLSGDRGRFAMEYSCSTPDGERWFLLCADPHRGAGPGRVVVQHIDFTERRRTERAAWVRARLLDEVDAAVIATDTASRVTVWNAGAEALYGWTSEETVGRHINELTVGPTEQEVAREIVDTVRREGRWEGEFRVRRKDGTSFPAHVRDAVLRDGDGRFAGLVGVSVDLTERVRQERELRSARDYLRAVTDTMAEGMCTLDLEGRVVYVNRAAERLLGWDADALLGQVFHTVARHRQPDGAAHPGEACPILRTQRTGEVVRRDDDVFVRRDGTTFPVDYTATAFEAPDGIRGVVVLFADITERKDREAGMRRELEDLAWIGRINDAIEDDRLVLHAQPIVDVATGDTVQHELLLRMRDADGTLIAPGRFLPAAERFGLVREIDRWVVRRAAELAAQGHAVELNVSAESIGDAGFATLVETELERAGADCSLVVVELTETALLRDEEAGRDFVERIQRLGCRLALDDFGTGYGGFTYLKRMAVDYLKIDIEFVRDLPRDAASQHVVRAVVSLAAGLGQKTVAEGVEDAETLRMLRELGVDYAQGYHLGRPVPLDQSLLSP